MIKANELRLTNLIIYNGEYKRVKDLFFMVKNPFEYDQIKAEPIPLTPEILEKAGFEKKTKITWFIQKNARKINLVLYRHTGEFTFPFNENGLIRIKHLHQLQNLYSALTGEELQITL